MILKRMDRKHRIATRESVGSKTTAATLIAIFLLSTVIPTMAILPTVSAHVPAWTIPTHAYGVAVPSTIGIDDYAALVVWVDQSPPSASGTTGPRWKGYQIDVTKPDGTKQTIGPFTCKSAVGSDWVIYTPDQVGTYTFVFSWPGQTLENMTGVGIRTQGLPYVGDYFAGSTSEPFKLTVQRQQVKEWVSSPLPTGYWQRPINGANREWTALASNWLKGSWLVDDFQRWSTAPESAHILWTSPINSAFTGGISDAAWPGIPSNVDDYESPWSVPIIMNGKIYYNAPPVSDSAKYGYYCRDLYTGELLFYKNGTDNGLNNPWSYQPSYAGTYPKGFMEVQTYLGLTQGWLYHYYSVNGQGILAYLIMVSGSTWYFLDAATGNWMFTLVNVPSGTAVTDQDGSLLKYTYNSNTGNLLCWNVSQAIPPPAPTGTTQQLWRGRFGLVIDAINDTTWTKAGTSEGIDAIDIAPRSGYTMNVTTVKNLLGSFTVLQDKNRVPKMIFGSATTNTAGTGIAAPPTADVFSAWLLRIDENAAPYSPNPTKTNTQNTNLGFGTTLLWNKNFTVPVTGKNYSWSVGSANYDNGIFILSCKQTMQRWGYNLTTGNLLWGPTAPEAAMNYYGMSNNQAYGMIYGTGYAGTLYAYDAKTGQLRWTYNATSIGEESPYGDNYPISLASISDGKIYLYSTEHSPTKPLWRGSYVRCINATDGTEIWKLLDFNMGLAIADGYIVSGNQYDNKIYCIGKGPSATTVSAPETAIQQGQNVLIKGTVTDLSPGAKGTPAISDADQETWMEYLYEQQEKPTSAIGVPVKLTAIDPNGNWQNIGTATSDTSGMYAITWKPPVVGLYKVTATFAGSKSYGGSEAETVFIVGEAQTPVAVVTPTPAPTQPTVMPTTAQTTQPASTTPSPTSNVIPPTSAQPTTTYIAIGAGVIVIVVAAALILRKRKN
jgi:outer membrane protein assembly factor BamB